MMKNSMEKHRMYPEWRPCQIDKKKSVATWDKVLLPRNFNRLNTCLCKEEGRGKNNNKMSWLYPQPQIKQQFVNLHPLSTNWTHRFMVSTTLPTTSLALVNSFRLILWHSTLFSKDDTDTHSLYLNYFFLSFELHICCSSHSPLDERGVWGCAG